MTSLPLSLRQLGIAISSQQPNNNLFPRPVDVKRTSYPKRLRRPQTAQIMALGSLIYGASINTTTTTSTTAAAAGILFVA